MKKSVSEGFDSRIVACYLYTITRYGYPPPARDTIKHIEEMAALGFKSIELEGIRKEHLSAIYEMRVDLKKCIDSLGLNVPYFCAVLPGLGSAEPVERNRNLELFRMGCEVAAELGALGILDNSPLPPFVFPEDIPVVRHYEEESLRLAFLPPNLQWDSYWEGLTATYAQACDIAAEFDLTYQMHPALGLLASSADGFLNFARDVDRSNLRFNFDVSNLFAMGENIVLAFLRLAPFVDYIHVSDNSGDHIEHLEIEQGIIPWTTFKDLIAESGLNPHFGIDVGGDESHVPDLDGAYIRSAEFIQSKFLS